MERELEKDLKEIEYLIYVHKERENTHTQSVLERAHEIIDTCAKAARTLPELEELLSRENDTEITRSSRDSQFGECSQREVYMKAYEDALNEDSVSEAFLADCKRVAQKYKKDNDDWMSVEERLPEKFGKYWATIRYNDGRISEPIVADFRGIRQKYVVDTPNGREYETWGIDSAFHGSRVIAWRPYYIPEPYHPERSNDEKE